MLRGVQLLSRLSGLSFVALTLLVACPGGGGETGASASGSTGSATSGTSGSSTGASGTTGAPGTSGPATGGATSSSSGTTGEPGTGGTTGGPGTGGTTGEPGTGTAGGTTGGTGGGACQVDADCMLHDDCCACYGLPVGPDDPACEKACDQSQCAAIGIDQAVCRFGVCTTEKVQCSGEVACDSLPPDCPPGTLPGISGACWSGACVPAAACDAVPDCSLCPDGTMCVEYQSLLPIRVCEPIPPKCAGKPSCGCAGKGVACEDPFTECNNGQAGEVVCICPTC